MSAWHIMKITNLENKILVYKTKTLNNWVIAATNITCQLYLLPQLRYY